MKFTILLKRSLLVNILTKFFLSMPMSRKEIFDRNNAFSLNGNTIEQEPCLGVHEIYKFGRPYFGHYYYILNLSDLCLGVERIFKEIISTFLTQNQVPLGAGVMKLAILVLPSLQLLNTKFGKDWLSSS